MLSTAEHTPFNGPFSGTTQVSHQKGKTNLDFTEARDSEWQWHQLGHMHVCTSLQTDNHASTPPLSFLHAGCPSYRPTNSVKALKETAELLHKKCTGKKPAKTGWIKWTFLLSKQCHQSNIKTKHIITLQSIILANDNIAYMSLFHALKSCTM